IDVLFPKVSDEDVAAEVGKLENMAAGNDPQPQSQAQPQAQPQTSRPGSESVQSAIDYEGFAAVDLRAGRIVNASKHPKADRLLVLEVDLGFEKRTIVAGIA